MSDIPPSQFPIPRGVHQMQLDLGYASPDQRPAASGWTPLSSDENPPAPERRSAPRGGERLSRSMRSIARVSPPLRLATPEDPLFQTEGPQPPSPERNAAITRYSSPWRIDDGDDSSVHDYMDPDHEFEELGISENVWPGVHPVSGAPIHGGNVSTQDLTNGRIEHIRWNDPDVRKALPDNVQWANTWRSSRSKGDVKVIPIQSGSDTPALRTRQADVTAARINDLVDNPEHGSTPRIPARFQRDLPVVYKESGMPHTIVDGNHRLTAAVLRGQLFHEVREINPENVSNVTSHNDLMGRRLRDSMDNPYRDDEADFKIAMHKDPELIEEGYGEGVSPHLPDFQPHPKHGWLG